MSGDGPAMFARFAYPPNVLGLCGPDDHAALLQASSAGGPDATEQLRHLAGDFAGAWPYLQLIAAANGIADPLDERVVSAYWIGNKLLAAVPAPWLAHEADRRFRRIAGRRFEQVSEAVACGGRPHHNFHVFAVYPWVGLLRADRTGEPLRVIDRCRIRSGVVGAVDSGSVVVDTTRLEFVGDRLTQRPHRESLIWQVDGSRLGAVPQVGDTVALHWDWVCLTLTPVQAATLESWTVHHLRIANRLLSAESPLPAA